MDWKPISTAPKDGTKVLIVNPLGAMDVSSYVRNWQERRVFVRPGINGDIYKSVLEDLGRWGSDTAFNPTHWMPLPPPPKDQP